MARPVADGTGTGTSPRLALETDQSTGAVRGTLSDVLQARDDGDPAQSRLPLSSVGNPPKYEATPQIGSPQTPVSRAGTPGPVYRPRLRRAAKTSTAPGQGLPGCGSHNRDCRRHPPDGLQLPGQAMPGTAEPADGTEHLRWHLGDRQSCSRGRDLGCRRLRCAGGGHLRLVHVLGLQGKQAHRREPGNRRFSRLNTTATSVPIPS
jgi:hypothetical protein